MIDFIKDADCTKETPVRLGVPDAPIYGKGIKLKPRVDGRTDSEHFKKIYLPELLPLEEYDLIVVLISGGKDSVACYLKLLELGVPKERIEYTEYTTYILGEGAIGFEDVGAKVPYEMVRDAKTRGGEDTLISRKRHAVSVAGVSYTKASQATNSPTNAELKTGKNWSLVASDTKAIEHKAVPIARIISRG